VALEHKGSERGQGKGQQPDPKASPPQTRLCPALPFCVSQPGARANGAPARYETRASAESESPTAAPAACVSGPAWNAETHLNI